MRFTYADDAPLAPRQPVRPARSPLQRGLTVALGIMVALATWEIATFAIDYWRALHG